MRSRCAGRGVAGLLLSGGAALLLVGCSNHDRGRSEAADRDHHRRSTAGHAEPSHPYWRPARWRSIDDVRSRREGSARGEPSPQGTRSAASAGDRAERHVAPQQRSAGAAAPIEVPLAVAQGAAAVPPKSRSDGAVPPAAGTASAQPPGVSAAAQPSAAQVAKPASASPHVAPAAVPSSQAGADAAAFGSAIEAARRMFMRGQVSKARAALLALVPGPRAEALLELARTFDPHYVALTSQPDAGADVKRARALYEEAVRLGSSAAKVDLLLLLNAKGQVPRT